MKPGTILMLVLAAGAVTAGTSTVDAQVVAPAAPSCGDVVSDESQGLGSLANPIPLNGIETSAPGLEVTRLRDGLEVCVGRLAASAFGVPEVALCVGEASGWTSDAMWTAESNVYSGGGMDIPIGSLGGLVLAGGQVMLRDPISITGSGGSGSRYWSTSAGVQVRF